ncbi:MAG: hypothetical protein WCO04_00090 [Pseudomonadota bacterium]
MKYEFKILSATALYLILSTVPVYAAPGIVIGFSYNFGTETPKLGVTTKVLSSDELDDVVAAAGVTYFFDDNSIGWDAGLGYTFDGGAATLSYDFRHKSPQFSLGFGDIHAPERHNI